MKKPWTVVDLFSGCGGMSYGFHRHQDFEVVAAADAQLGKPSSPRGALQCNSTYRLNMGITPVEVDLAAVTPRELRRRFGLSANESVDVLCCCPPCTGFSRANPDNHMRDDTRNALVPKTADFAREFGARVVVMENARELLTGNFRHHFLALRQRLEALDYAVHAAVYNLSEFGLPQQRERALVIATRKPHQPRSLRHLWGGLLVDRAACTVRRALQTRCRAGDPANRFPAFATPEVADRIAAIPHDGGSWIDLTKNRQTLRHLTPAMHRILAKGRIGSHPDIYGRMWWDRPAPTIKRECAHVGNGRYAHPVQDRLLTVREMALLQGFPVDFQFNGAALSNLYRHIGDAVPPLVSYQLAWLVAWTFGARKPTPEQLLLKGTHLRTGDIVQPLSIH
jgi:DNA (cytosine-5)-methyltransferase 1